MTLPNGKDLKEIELNTIISSTNIRYKEAKEIMIHFFFHILLIFTVLIRNLHDLVFQKTNQCGTVKY